MKEIVTLALSGVLITGLGVTMLITTGGGLEIAGIGIAYIKAALLTAGALQLFEAVAKWRAWFATLSPATEQKLEIAGKIIQILAAVALIGFGIAIMVSTWGAGSLISLGAFSLATEILGGVLIVSGLISAVPTLWRNRPSFFSTCCQPQEEAIVAPAAVPSIAAPQAQAAQPA